MTREAAEHKIKRDAEALQAALRSYNAVFQAWPNLNAETVDSCRRIAMAAALGAALSNGEQR